MITEDKIEEGKRALEFLDMQGYRRCNIAACNCPYWHGGNASDRLQEIHEVLSEAGFEPHRKTAIRAIESMRDEIFNMRQHIAALEDGIRLILPLAKGYAAIHCDVQSSRNYIDKAESLLPQNEGIKS